MSPCSGMLRDYERERERGEEARRRGPRLGSPRARAAARGRAGGRRTPPRPRACARFGRIVASDNYRGTEYVSESFIKWMSGGATRQCDQALEPTRGGGGAFSAARRSEKGVRLAQRVCKWAAHACLREYS
jgi:hypothetical protein